MGYLCMSSVSLALSHWLCLTGSHCLTGSVSLSHWHPISLALSHWLTISQTAGDGLPEYVICDRLGKQQVDLGIERILVGTFEVI